MKTAIDLYEENGAIQSASIQCTASCFSTGSEFQVQFYQQQLRV